MPIYSVDTGQGQLNILSVHVPKTGGTTISDFFQSAGFIQHFGTEHQAIRPLMLCPPQHYHYDILNQLFYISSTDYSFAVVRDPLKRIISDYYWSISKSTLKIKFLDINEWVLFVFNEYSKNNFFLANHIRPQHEFVGPEIKRIFKYEEGLNNIIRTVLADCGLTSSEEIVLPVSNKTKYPNELSISDSTISLIREFYSQDYKLFNY